MLHEAGKSRGLTARPATRVLNMPHESGRNRSENVTDQASLSGPYRTISVSQVNLK